MLLFFAFFPESVLIEDFLSLGAECLLKIKYFVSSDLKAERTVGLRRRGG